MSETVFTAEVGIMGYGVVGQFMHTLFPEARIYDKYKPELATSKHRAEACNARIVFIAVPTPNLPDGSLDTTEVEACVKDINYDSIIVSRSTLNPGTADSLSTRYNKKILVQPEHLGESPDHPLTNSKSRNFLIIGGEPEDRRQLINLYHTVYNASVDIMQVSAFEAEIIKLGENRAIAFKVSQCQELYDMCERVGVDYYTIRDGIYKMDPRFDTWFTAIYPKDRGMNSKCIPKDIYAYEAWCKKHEYDPLITKAILAKNREWLELNKANHGIYS